ncbi:MAG: hypothetical protein BWX79_02375 [Alphaproteobacteria bacterium ADurb.Bin100]|nr:MAG: hypothetical protein BWX79_02375 [Alphaproteobacteria bacterium ADurb.Bin100]
MEADFQREYGLDLGAAVEVMSWRRFCALVQGLSASSATVMMMEHNRNVIDEEHAEAAVRRLWR